MSNKIAKLAAVLCIAIFSFSATVACKSFSLSTGTAVVEIDGDKAEVDGVDIKAEK